MYKIGEFSKIVEITVKGLRYYDDINLMKPAFINEENGYRYYDDNNYKQAMWVKSMKKFGFTIKEIQDVLPNVHQDDDLTDYLLEKNEQIAEQINSMKKLQHLIHDEIQTLKELGDVKMSMKAEIIEVPDMRVASVRYKGKYEEVGKYLGILYKNVGMKGASEPFSMYHDHEFMEENADVEVCVEVKQDVNKGEVASKTLPGGRFVALTHIGPYDTLSHSYKAIADYMTENNLEGAIPSREIYLKGPGMLFKGNPKKYETRILIPIK